MPGPQPAMLKNLVKIAFKAHAIVLPTKWKQPVGNPEGRQYIDAFKLTELVRPFSASKLFLPATPNKYHVDTQKKLHKQFDKYIDGICDAICGAWDKWRLQAKFSNLIINGPVAVGSPGCLKGPKLKSLIMMQAPKSSPAEKKYSDSVAKHLSKAWGDWQGKVMVPGLPWYPAFTAFPLAMAPPMPNIPMPLIVCPSAMAAEMLVPSKLKDGMVKAHNDKKALHHKELFDSIGKGVSVVFLIWLVSQQIMNVLGKGPVPTYAPPYVPVGPVVGGQNIAVPGHLSA
ncbi:MAG: hypothetical protein KC502_02740 [Myxococcales bacterium]|nr:hypothetical protein [Myxococcales bacterium]